MAIVVHDRQGDDMDARSRVTEVVALRGARFGQLCASDEERISELRPRGIAVVVLDDLYGMVNDRGRG